MSDAELKTKIHSNMFDLTRPDMLYNFIKNVEQSCRFSIDCYREDVAKLEKRVEELEKESHTHIRDTMIHNTWIEKSQKRKVKK